MQSGKASETELALAKRLWKKQGKFDQNDWAKLRALFRGYFGLCRHIIKKYMPTDRDGFDKMACKECSEVFYEAKVDIKSQIIIALNSGKLGAFDHGFLTRCLNAPMNEAEKRAAFKILKGLK
jgi:hypothetical protein